MHQTFLHADTPIYSAGLKHSSSNALGCLRALVFLYACATKHPLVPGGLLQPLGPCFSERAVCVSMCMGGCTHEGTGQHVESKWEAGGLLAPHYYQW